MKKTEQRIHHSGDIAKILDQLGDLTHCQCGSELVRTSTEFVTCSSFSRCPHARLYCGAERRRNIDRLMRCLKISLPLNFRPQKARSQLVQHIISQCVDDSAGVLSSPEQLVPKKKKRVPAKKS
jgi:hypothetical protein